MPDVFPVGEMTLRHRVSGWYRITFYENWGFFPSFCIDYLNWESFKLSVIHIVHTLMSSSACRVRKSLHCITINRRKEENHGRTTRRNK